MAGSTKGSTCTFALHVNEVYPTPLPAHSPTHVPSQPTTAAQKPPLGRVPSPPVWVSTWTHLANGGDEKGKWREANRHRQLQTAIQPGVMPNNRFPPAGDVSKIFAPSPPFPHFLQLQLTWEEDEEGKTRLSTGVHFREGSYALPLDGTG